MIVNGKDDIPFIMEYKNKMIETSNQIMPDGYFHHLHCASTPAGTSYACLPEGNFLAKRNGTNHIFFPEKQVLRPLLTEKQVPQVDSEEKHLGTLGRKAIYAKELPSFNQRDTWELEEYVCCNALYIIEMIM